MTLSKLKKKAIFGVSLAVIVLALTFAGLELISYLAFSQQERTAGPAQFFSLQHNQFIEDIGQQVGCSFAQTTIGHSMLGFTHRRNGTLSSQCQMSINNIGINTTRDLPLTKQLEDFAILIVGGSVANLLANYQISPENTYLEDLLNHTYKPPGAKKRFRIYNGAAGAWAMPNQLNMMIMYDERIDGVIAVDGYNEGFPIGAGRRLEQIPAATQILTNLSKDDWKFDYMNSLARYKHMVASSFLKHSYFFNIVYKFLATALGKWIIPEKVTNEFYEGNTERLPLTNEAAKEWSAQSLERYCAKLHIFGQKLGLKTAQFLQPTRLFGKTLTEDEKLAMEFIKESDYRRIQKSYLKLSRQGLPVFDLTEVFIAEKERIYSDHIHYLQNDNGISRGNELVAQAIVHQLGSAWGLKKRELIAQ